MDAFGGILVRTERPGEERGLEEATNCSARKAELREQRTTRKDPHR